MSDDVVRGDENASGDIRARATILDALAGAETEQTHDWVRHDVDAFGHDLTYWTCERCNGFMPRLSDVPDEAATLALYPRPCVSKADQMNAINDGEHPQRHIVMLHQTSIACPSQWEGLTSSGECVYIRYRSGYGRIGFGRTVDEAVDDESTFIWYGDDPMDGVISLEEVQALAPAYITFENGISGEWDENLDNLLEAVRDLWEKETAGAVDTE